MVNANCLIVRVLASNLYYQYIIYSAAVTKVTKSAPTTKPGCALNILVSTSNPLGTTPFAFSILLMRYIPMIQMTNTNPIRSRKGISYKPLAGFTTAKPVECKKDRSAKFGRNLKKTDNRNPPIVANNAALEVVFFQKKPRINMAKIPGDTKPVYSWIY